MHLVGIAFALLACTGCAGTWDTITSRQFRKEPFHTTHLMFSPEDPLVVLRSDPPRDGDVRAKAMRRLKEPATSGLTQQDQDEVIDILARAATSDPSPVLRMAAIDTLGRFSDPRVPGILIIAYQKAHGRPDGVADPLKTDSKIQQVSARSDRGSNRSTAVIPLVPPVGFLSDAVTAIRCRAAESLGRTNKPEVVQFLASIAVGPIGDTAQEGAEERDVRLAAIRGLGACRQVESVGVLVRVLATEKEKGNDNSVVGRAHEGLVALTGKKLPAEPEKWNEVVQAGVVIAPSPTWVDSAVQNAAAWVKR